jgi:phosphoserine phosphatase
VTNAALFDVDKTLVTAWAKQIGVDLCEASFYTDSITDLPMLAVVGRPRIINPDFRLRRLAKQRGYPIEAWT